MSKAKSNKSGRSDSSSARATELRDKALDLFQEAIDIEKTDGDEPSFGDFESTVLEKGEEMMRLLLERELQKRSDSLAPKLKIRRQGDSDDVTYRQHEQSVGTYHSLCGPLIVERYRYREVGSNGKSVVPLEAVAGLLEDMTPKLAGCLAHGYCNQGMRAFREDLVAAHRSPPSRSTMERKAKALGSKTDLGVASFEASVMEDETLPVGTTAVVLGLDRTSVPMEEDAPSKTTRRRKPRIRKAPDPVTVQFRMDYVGTVSFVDSDGETLGQRYYRAASNSNAEQIANRMASEVEHALKQDKQLKVAIVQDGAPELWVALRASLTALSTTVGWTETLDWFHAMERLTDCLELCVPGETERAEQRRLWSEALANQDQAIEIIILSLHEHAKGLKKNEAEKLAGHARYFSARTSQMCYRTTRDKGLPIGSGATEGACKSLVGSRAKRGGQRWRPEGLGAVLSLRAIRRSGRFEPFWAEFKQRARPYSCSPA